MNKKTIICSALAIIVLLLIVFIIFINKTTLKNNINQNADEINISNKNTNEATELNVNTESNNTKPLNQEQLEEKEAKTDMLIIKVNGNILEIELEDNEATKSLVDKLKNGDITINANEYGGFEKIGNLGFNLPRSDTNISTSEGDLVLYQGNQISLFYNSNSWSYTKLGKVQNVDSGKLKNILGSGDVTLTLSLK